MTDSETLDAIAALLDGAEWTAETIEHVAQFVIESGRTIREPHEVDA